MLRAVVDMGTNSMRLLLIDDKEIVQRKLGKGKLIKKIIKTTRIGRKVAETGMLQEDAIKENIDALKEMKEIAKDKGASTITCVATEAVRKSKNRDKFIDLVKIETGLVMNLIDGQKEALFGFEGACINFKDDRDMVVMDTGGGSTEITRGKNGKIIYGQSTPMGCVILMEKFNKKDLDRKSILDEDLASEYIEKCLNNLDEDLYPYKDFILISIGGTATTLSSINQGLEHYDPSLVNGDIISYDEVEGLFARLNNMDVALRAQIPTMQAKRADIIPSGALILRQVMKKFKAKEVIVSEFDNLDGLSLHLDEFDHVEL